MSGRARPARYTGEAARPRRPGRQSDRAHTRRADHPHTRPATVTGREDTR